MTAFDQWIEITWDNKDLLYEGCKVTYLKPEQKGIIYEINNLILEDRVLIADHTVVTTRQKVYSPKIVINLTNNIGMVQYLLVENKPVDLDCDDDDCI